MIENEKTLQASPKHIVPCPKCNTKLFVSRQDVAYKCPKCETLFQAKKAKKPRKTFNLNQFLIKVKFDSWKGWIYLIPTLILLAIFTVWPIINTVRISLLEGYGGLSAVGGETFQFGFGNFEKVIQYKGFLTCLKNTMLLCLLTVPISTFLALLIAVCLNSIKPLQKFLQKSQRFHFQLHLLTP